ASRGDVDVGGAVIQVAAGGVHTCALLDTGTVRCWGANSSGELGYGNTLRIGDDETPASAGDVDVGGVVTQIALGGNHTCALLDSGAVRCWGLAANGQLGYGSTETIGDDETPASAGDVDVGGRVTRIAAGGNHTCALLDNGAVRCWGAGLLGQLGYGATEQIGDDETPASVGDVDIGGPATQVSVGGGHTCALLAGGAVRCWGDGSGGRLGYGDTRSIGDDETPATAGDVDIGSSVVQVVAAGEHSCVVTTGGAIRCWGVGGSGALGYGNTMDVGDDEVPAAAGDVLVS
ncbi:MAG: chromosome condensation regulator, partial [Gemmatimonadota bacterium]